MMMDYSKANYKIMPVSVIDVEAQKKRKGACHDEKSSRASFSPFPNEISDLCYEYFLRDCDTIADPFAGWGERHSKALEYGKKYSGYDISKEAIALAKQDYGVDNIFGNSMLVTPEKFNGLLTCPPYWNLEKYDSASGIDRDKTWVDFVYNLEKIFQNFWDQAEDGAIFCVMVGDWRKNHVYYDLDYQVCKIFKDLGARIVDKVVVSRKKVSKIKIMLPQAKRLGYTVKVHESLLVFKKVS